MNDIEFCFENNLMLGVPAKDKRSVVQIIASHLALRTGMPFNVIFDGLMDREALGSTGFGDGFALPHALISDLSTPARVLVTLREPIDFDAADDEAVDIFVAVIWPQEQHDGSLQHLAKLCRLFRSKKLLVALRSARSETEASILISAHAGKTALDAQLPSTASPSVLVP